MKTDQIIPYHPTIKIDRHNANKPHLLIMHAISAMPHYQEKSFEELRMEYYLAGNRGSLEGSAPGQYKEIDFGIAKSPPLLAIIREQGK